MDVITRRQDPLVKKLCALRDDREGNSIFLEGPRLIQEAVQAGLRIDSLILRQGMEASFPAKQTVTVNDSVSRYLSDVEEPQGIAAVCAKPRWGWEDLFKRTPAPILILDGVQNPGNAAGILRTAEAAGAAGVVTTPGTASLFSPKALRGAMGATFRLPSLEHITIKEIASRLKESAYSLLGSGPNLKGGGDWGLTPISYLSVDWGRAWAILMGQEGGGVASEWVSHLQHVVSIPMNPPVESLNVGAAAAVLLYESLRQRSRS